MHAYEEVMDSAQEKGRGCTVTRVRCTDKAALKSEKILEAFIRKPNVGQNDQEALNENEPRPSSKSLLDVNQLSRLVLVAFENSL